MEFTVSDLVYPLLIFCARILDVPLGTMRIIFVSKGQKFLAPLLGFFEVLLWIIVMAKIMQHLNNPIYYVAYAGGFSAGTFVGMLLENKLAMGVSLIRVITAVEADELVHALRSRGYTVTDVDAVGNRGPVRVIFAAIKRKEIKTFIDLVLKFNPKAFYTIEEMSFVSKSYMPLSTQKRNQLERLFIPKKK